MLCAMRSILEKNNFQIGSFGGAKYQLVPLFLALFRQRPQNHPCWRSIGALEFQWQTDQFVTSCGYVLERESFENADSSGGEGFVSGQVFAGQKVNAGCVRAEEFDAVFAEGFWQARFNNGVLAWEGGPFVWLSGVEQDFADTLEVDSFEQIWRECF
jgi:hypothetical protein